MEAIEFTGTSPAGINLQDVQHKLDLNVEELEEAVEPSPYFWAGLGTGAAAAGGLYAGVATGVIVT